MMKNILIVESPTKARTLKKYLGPEFQIIASVGHIKDLPNNKLGVDIENGFTPEYVNIKGKTKTLKEIKTAGNAEKIPPNIGPPTLLMKTANVIIKPLKTALPKI